MRKIVVGTRASELAITQTKWVIEQLEKQGVKNPFEIKKITTEGDRNRKDPLYKFGGKGVFTSDIQVALENREIDMAVHSLKDLSLHENERFTLASFPKRADHRDAYVGRTDTLLKDLPKAAVIGTSSPRRASFIHAHYPHLKTAPIRGPVEMRLEQSRQGKYDGVILAVAGLERLDLVDTITEYLEVEDFTPAAGQGALAIECLSEDHEIIDIVRKINDPITEKSVLTERAFVRALDEDDEVPIGAYAAVSGKHLTLYGSISSLDGSKAIFVQESGTDPEAVAENAAAKANDQGASTIIQLAKEELALR